MSSEDHLYKLTGKSYCTQAIYISWMPAIASIILFVDEWFFQAIGENQELSPISATGFLPY
jgi:hypothetical protein